MQHRSPADRTLAELYSQRVACEYELRIARARKFSVTAQRKIICRWQDVERRIAVSGGHPLTVD